MEDERGNTWILYDGDAAWDQWQSLSKARVVEVVLPRETLLHGSLPSSDSINIPVVPLESVRISSDVQTIVHRQIRLKDCIQWLAMSGLEG